jgi:hypothetical protein
VITVLFSNAEPNDARSHALPKFANVGDVGGPSGDAAICRGSFKDRVTNAYTGNRKPTATAIINNSRPNVRSP